MVQDLLAVTMEWPISELIKRPKIFKKATDELKRVIGREGGSRRRIKDEHHLPCMEAIFKETMRMHPAAPMLVPRQAHKHGKAAGTRILIDVWSIVRNRTSWHAPEEFRPERFIGIKKDV
uniref:Cytochrome P450 71A1-like n=1 Tax=Elaeis guineensis var. tenera TaxID=51953 RepID=A0A6I9QQ57_ELAGV|nr:cytochrome P450 71A1-like [Elaeis guineensis]